MVHRIKIAFLLLILFQALHSMEEYYGQLWKKLAPAKFLSNLVSSNPEKGFILINIGLFVFGLSCWLIVIHKKKLIAPSLIWLWVVVELINGIGHPLWAINEGGYIPGLLTAPFLLFISVYLARQVLQLYSEKSGVR